MPYHHKERKPDQLTSQNNQAMAVTDKAETITEKVPVQIDTNHSAEIKRHGVMMLDHKNAWNVATVNTKGMKHAQPRMSAVVIVMVETILLRSVSKNHQPIMLMNMNLMSVTIITIKAQYMTANLNQMTSTLSQYTTLIWSVQWVKLMVNGLKLSRLNTKMSRSR